MNHFFNFLGHTRLWIVPLGMLWLYLLSLQLESGFLRYETVDAAYYKELAMDFVSGRPMVLDGLKNEKENAFSPYPPGYPVLLGIFIKLGGGDFNWPVQLILHAVLLFVLVLIWHENLSLLPLGVLIFSDSLLILAGSGISEFAFILFSILAVLSLTRVETSHRPFWQFLLLLSLAACIFMRYAAVYFLPFLLMKWYFLRLDDREKASNMHLPIGFFILICFTLFGIQLADTGLPTGGDRYANSDSYLDLARGLVLGIADQLLIFRDISGSNPKAVFIGSLLMLFLWNSLRKRFPENHLNPSLSEESEKTVFRNAFSRNLLYAGLFYFLFIIPVRWHYYFAEGFDNRLLAPGACLLWLGFLVSKEVEILRLPFWKKMLFLISASLFFLPKREIWAWLIS
jgi:hypothetical protein